jgi:hypothetical protein
MTLGGSFGGGGGSGGGILLAAREIMLDGIVSAEGGDSGYTGVTQAPAGGAGGGGRVAFYANDAWLAWSQGPEYTNHPPAVSIRGGVITQSQESPHPGEDGTFYAGETPDFLPGTGTLLLLR